MRERGGIGWEGFGARSSQRPSQMQTHTERVSPNRPFNQPLFLALHPHYPHLNKKGQHIIHNTPDNEPLVRQRGSCFTSFGLGCCARLCRGRCQAYDMLLYDGELVLAASCKPHALSGTNKLLRHAHLGCLIDGRFATRHPAGWDVAKAGFQLTSSEAGPHRLSTPLAARAQQDRYTCTTDVHAAATATGAPPQIF